MTAVCNELDCFGLKGNAVAEKAAARSSPRRICATYDIAQTTVENQDHWGNADNLDADRANSPAVRQKARSRSRYETDNNPSLKGIVRTIVNYEVGPGPTLHVDHEDEEFARDVEKRWQKWCQAVHFRRKLRTMVYSRETDGESFARLGHNPRLKNPVPVDWQPFETDRCHTMWLPYMTPTRVDGVWFDDWGNPTYYDVLRYHPGGVFPMPTWVSDTVPAQYILHLFAVERPNQHRGMPDFASSLDLFGDRRRHRKATVRAAEAVADIAVFLTTQMAPGDSAEITDPTPVSIPRGSMVVAPEGYDAKQIAAEHPNGTYSEFSAETLNEAARPASMPLNVAKCDSSRYNFASGRLDITTFYAAVANSQLDDTELIVEPLFEAWYVEARLRFDIKGRKWSEIDGGEAPDHEHLWHGQPYSDPKVEQDADESGVATGLRGMQEIYARRGRDWKTQLVVNAKALGFDTPDSYLEWIKQNLTPGKGGGAGLPGPKPPGAAAAAGANGNGRAKQPVEVA